MKQLKYGLLLVVTLLIACSDSGPIVFSLDETISVASGESATLNLPIENEYIDLMVLSIEESRCPANANCVRFGEARVTVGVNGTEEILKTLNLCIGDCPERGGSVITADTMVVELDNKDYAVILQDVTPYPTTGNGALVKYASLRIIDWQ